MQKPNDLLANVWAKVTPFVYNNEAKNVESSVFGIFRSSTVSRRIFDRQYSKHDHSKHQTHVQKIGKQIRFHWVDSSELRRPWNLASNEETFILLNSVEWKFSFIIESNRK